MPKIICGNNQEILADMPADSIDLTVTSPPYDDMRTYNGYRFELGKFITELYRVTKPGGVVVWVVADQTKDHAMSGTSFRQALTFMDAGFNLYHHMIYQRTRRQIDIPAGAYFNDFENMFVFSKGKPKTYNVIRDVKNVQSGTTHKKRNRNVDGTRGNEQHIPISNYGKRGRVWFYYTGLYHSTSDKIAYEHPAIFPEKLAADHIKTWSNKGDMVLDPFCGSGTTLKMAAHLGRNYTGIDISQEYCELSKRRVAEIQTVLEARK